MENAEYFSGDAVTASDSSTDSSVYGTGSYSDWVKAQAVDPQVMQNHSDFIKDMKASSGNVTGRTYTPQGESDGYNDIPWVGLRKPQNVPVGNPTQLSEFNNTNYTNSPTFTWASTS
jgi:hypothetical protein